MWKALCLALITAAVATALALLLSWTRRRHPDGLTAWTVRLAVLGYAMPGVVLAAGVFVPIAWLDERLRLCWHRWALKPGHSQGQPGWNAAGAGRTLFGGGLQRHGCGNAAHHAQPRRGLRLLGPGAMANLASLTFAAAAHGLAFRVLMVAVDVMKEMPITLMMRQLGGHLGGARFSAHLRIDGPSGRSCPRWRLCWWGLLPRDLAWCLQTEKHRLRPVKNIAGFCDAC